MPGGRPSKFTPENRRLILDAVAAGNYLETAAQRGGVDYSTMRIWVLRGQEVARKRDEGLLEPYPPIRKGTRDDRMTRREKRQYELDKAAFDAERTIDLQYLEFSEALTRADNDAENAAVLGWQVAGRDDWRAHAEFLARRFRDRWAPKERAGKLEVDEDAMRLIFDVIGRAVTDQATLDRLRAEFAQLAAGDLPA